MEALDGPWTVPGMLTNCYSLTVQLSKEAVTRSGDSNPDGPTRPRHPRLLVTAVAGLVFVMAAASALLVFFTDEAQVRAIVAEAGIWGPIVYILLQAAQIVLAPVPGQFVTLAAGRLFGPVWGFIYSLVGTALGASVTFWLGRLLGRPIIELLVGAEELARWERRWRPDRPVVWFAVLLLPVPDAVFYLAGLTAIRWPAFLLAAVLGRAPGLFLAVAFGYVLGELPWWVLVPAVVVPLALYWLFRKPLARYQRRLFRRWYRALNQNRTSRPGPKA